MPDFSWIFLKFLKVSNFSIKLTILSYRKIQTSKNSSFNNKRVEPPLSHSNLSPHSRLNMINYYLNCLFDVKSLIIALLFVLKKERHRSGLETMKNGATKWNLELKNCVFFFFFVSISSQWSIKISHTTNYCVIFNFHVSFLMIY